MRVIAIQPGYDNVTLRKPGEVFEMPDGSKGSWFKPEPKAVEDHKDHPEKVKPKYKP